MLASIFGVPENYGSPESLAGLQTRSSVNTLLQSRIAAGGPNAQDMMKQQLQAAQAELSKMKQKLTKGGTSTDDEFPDFKPNNQRSKTFAQRMEYGLNIQFAKSNLLPSIADIAVTAGYKINDNSSAGLGISYKLGMGSFQHIRFSHQGIGLRSYVDWKIKKNLFVSGGGELNHNSEFRKFSQLQNEANWQVAGLVGLMKKLPLKSKFTKTTRFQILYDFLYRTHKPVSQPILFRVGYGF
ncbi:hypothetical protein [Ferruginibacter sp. HRS2-29]|uniref:hypothetical protein n=1 Tax=Ferruginibacter sp. HRS2-29 TaxID=2487334 RepID=UPI0020CD00CB|nr:hypothetical protein [Ferruginibacter sp. HRS2-29]MCP9749780.1 hypothetical protein [Ferruginibacter sp. HRS2-29]